MEDCLISFETAKLAKEKGFEEYTSKTYKEYIKDRLLFDFKYGEDILLKNKGTVVLSYRIPFSEEEWSYFIPYPAPSQSLLQKWIREKHDLHIGIGLELHGENPKSFWFYIENIKNGSIVNIDKLNDAVFSYEEALEAGLVEALRKV